MKNCSVVRLYSIVSLAIMWLLPCFAFAQLDVSLSTNDNTNCHGMPCNYNGPSILINELMMSPLEFDGSLYGGTALQGGEWIELYNPNLCEPIDISCFYLGNNANDSDPYPGGYVIPSGTVVPPSGFALIRGTNAAPVPANLLLENGGNVVELIVDSTGVCVGGGSRLWFPNTGGWFAFYDNNGVPQDAVSWATQANTDQQPCVPISLDCGFSGPLSNYDDFPPERKNYVLSVSAANFQGESIRRMPDGGIWDGTETPTYAYTNSPPPIPPIIICNGSALAEPIDGNPPYSYQWDDPQAQTTQLADSLCAGVYCVTITDASNDTVQQCIMVEDYAFEVIISDGLCPNGSYTLPDNSVVTQPGSYPFQFQTSDGCDSMVTVNLSYFPSQNYVIDKQICENHTYILPDGTEVGVTGTYDFAYQNIFGCDSNYTVNLVVTNPIHLFIDTLFCEGTSYALPDSTIVMDEGYYEVLVPGDPTSCDTLFAVTLGFHPGFQIAIDEQIDVTCFGDSNGAISLAIAGSTGPFIYEWSNGVSNDSIAEDLPPNEYYIQVTDTLGCQNIVSVIVNEPDNIALSLSGDTLICPGSNSQMMVQASGGTGGFTYFWNVGVTDTSVIEVNPSTDTTYSVYALDDNGCISESVEMDVNLIAMDIGELTISDDMTICPGDSASIFADYLGSYPPYEFIWTNGLGVGQGPFYISPSEPTAYVLTVIDECGNSVSDEVTVSLFESPVAIAPGDLIAGCSPLEVELFDSLNTSPGYTHEWLLANGDSYMGNPVSFVLDESNIYEVTLMVTSPDGCSAISENTAPIEVYQSPVASFTASTWSTNLDEPNITFYDYSSGHISSIWTIDNTIFEYQSDITHAFQDTGQYAVQIMVENEFGCRDSLTQWITINIGYDFSVPNAFVPLGDSGDDPYYDPTSTTNTVFYPFFEYVEEYKMSIFNRWGELIFESSEKKKGWNGTYRDNPCPQDVYVYKIELVFTDGNKAIKVGDVTLLR